MLRLENVSVAYGKHEALHGVSIDVPAARTTVILGANGAGKTTLLKTIAGLVPAKPGRAEYVQHFCRCFANCMSDAAFAWYRACFKNVSQQSRFAGQQ
jgi:ABC-type cobalamin/Fe3+-siderophores transport system ATPase subunit